MKSQEKQALQELSDCVGAFIRYWGFRKIHGEIWTLLYLSRRALSGVDLVELLDVSKSLVSPALKELEQEGLIAEVESENAKIRRYVAVEDVGSIIRRVLRSREAPMLARTQTALEKVEGHRAEGGFGDFIDVDRAKSLERMIGNARTGLELMLMSGDPWS